eukprot:14880093-Alexandrium_andersonii.AAC.1
MVDPNARACNTRLKECQHATQHKATPSTDIPTHCAHAHIHIALTLPPSPRCTHPRQQCTTHRQFQTPCQAPCVDVGKHWLTDTTQSAWNRPPTTKHTDKCL